MADSKQGSLATNKVYSPEIVPLSYKSLLTCIMGDSKVFDMENASPLKIVGFFKGASEALKHRKMIHRRREETSGLCVAPLIGGRRRNRHRNENWSSP
jgi:hypothetical protein